MFAITVLLKFMGYSVSNIWRNEPFDCVCVIDFLFSQTSTRKHIASILKLHDSGKRLDYFLVFSNLTALMVEECILFSFYFKKTYRDFHYGL